MENYEKKYKEALERAKKLGTPAMPLDPKRSVGEQIFSELEDERIIRKLQECLEQYTRFADMPADEIITWLGKQGK